MFEIVKPIDPRWERRKKQIWIALAVVIVAAPLLYYYFKNWPEERAVRSFLSALAQGDYPDAYRIWKPASSYRYDDFIRDWGEKSEYGRVTSFHITESHERGSGVIVTALINQKEARIWVEKKNKSLGFPPF